MTTINKVVRQAIFYMLLVLFWQGAYFVCVSTFKIWKPYAFPNPAGVYKSLELLIKQNMLFDTVLFSLRRAFIGYIISVAVGAAMGILLVKIKAFSDLLKPLMLGIQTLPSVCWVPFAVLWFGLSESSILFVIVMGSSFSIAISSDMAIRNVNPVYVKAAKTMGAKGLKIYTRVVLPASLPALISGLKQGWSFAWRSLMAGEVMTATIGLGQALTMGRDLADINRVMLIIIIIIIIGVLIEKSLFSTIENKVLIRLGLI